MPTELDPQYALFAANAYSQSGDVVSPEKTIPIPSGWSPIAERSESNGFLVCAYRNDDTGEAVVANGGTTFDRWGSTARAACCTTIPRRTPFTSYRMVAAGKRSRTRSIARRCRGGFTA